jgi:hypothetical protein
MDEKQREESNSPVPMHQARSPTNVPKSPRRLSFSAIDAKERKGSFDASPPSPKHSSAATTTMLLMQSPLSQHLPNGDDEKFRISSRDG